MKDDTTMKKPRKTEAQAITETKLEGETVTVSIRGAEYTLCWDMEAVMRCEDAFAAAGYELNLMEATVRFNTPNLRRMFLAMLERYHADLSFEERSKLWTTSTYQFLGRIVASLYVEAVKSDQGRSDVVVPTVASAAL